jgi:hypothetical protein
MATVNTLKIGSTSYPIEDTTARATGTSASSEAEYDRQDVNGLYEGRSLITILGASSFDDCIAKLHSRVASANFTGLRRMDYIDVTPTSTTVNRGSAIRYRIADFDKYYQYGDTVTGHNIAMVPDAPIDMTGSTYATNTSYIAWNTTNTNQGTSSESNPYLASNLHKWEIGEFLPALPSSLRNVLIDPRAWVEDRYSSSGSLTDSTGASWKNLGKIFSLSETEVYGQCVWGTKAYSVGQDEQWGIFRGKRGKGMRNSRNNWWLRSVQSGSSSSVCYVSNNGYAGCLDATNEWRRPLPCFLLG